ncbi:MAG: DUF2461 domain-containing protein [Nitrospirota bacterium]|jgi:uncharacterized protein (TIGR02453 family)
MARSFSGFPKELFAFLEELARNNNREWFGANKRRYEADVVEPVLRFIEAVGVEVLPRISKSFVADPRKSGGSMFRIFRDTRFSHDKRPYKENVGCQFRHVLGRDVHAPGFYVHLEPGRVFVGAGAWKPAQPALEQMRAAIVARPEAWSRVIEDPELSSHFGGIEGESLKRPPKGIDADHPHIEDLKRKSHFVLKDVAPSRVLRPAFLDDVEETFTRASPLMRLLTEAVGLSY